MYPKDFRQPLVETDILGGPLEPTNEGYAIAKIAGSKMCETASASLGLNYRTLIPSSLYGPGDNFNFNTSHLVASIIRKVHNSKSTSGKEIEVWGQGQARREFTYVQDLAEWITDALPNISELPAVLNLGIGIDYSIKEFYESAMEALGHSATLVYDDSKPEGMMAKLMSSRVAKENFGWDPQTSLIQGIQKTYKWFIENEASVARI
jgi:GDP-L-fucose synthase